MTDEEFRIAFAETPLLAHYEACTVSEQKELRRILDRIHGCFDLWYTGGKKPQLRFGFKDLHKQKADCVIGRLDVGARPPLLKLHFGANGQNGGWAPREGQGLPIATADDLPADCDGFLRQRAEQAQAIGVDNLGQPAVPARAGRYWPSDYR